MQQYIIDTNFILRYLLADNKEQFQETKKIFNQAKDGKLRIILQEVVFVEVIFVLLSFYEVPKEKIIETMQGLLTYKGVETTKDILLEALRIYQQHNIHIVDAIIIAKQKFSGAKILSFDKKLKQVASSET